MYRNPDRLVIEINAPMGLLNLEALTETETIRPQKADDGAH